MILFLEIDFDWENPPASAVRFEGGQGGCSNQVNFPQKMPKIPYLYQKNNPKPP
jgi:hypothetical protein